MFLAKRAGLNESTRTAESLATKHLGRDLPASAVVKCQSIIYLIMLKGSISHRAELLACSHTQYYVPTNSLTIRKALKAISN